MLPGAWSAIAQMSGLIILFAAIAFGGMLAIDYGREKPTDDI